MGGDVTCGAWRVPHTNTHHARDLLDDAAVAAMGGSGVGANSVPSSPAHKKSRGGGGGEGEADAFRKPDLPPPTSTAEPAASGAKPKNPKRAIHVAAQIMGIELGEAHAGLATPGDDLDESDKDAAGSATTTNKARYTNYQIKILTAAYELSTKPDEKQRANLGHAVGLTERQIKIWFQNRRQRQRGYNQDAENEVLKRENDAIFADLEAIRHRNRMLELENGEIQANLNRKRSQLEDLRRKTTELLQMYRAEFSTMNQMGGNAPEHMAGSFL